ncbi:MAG: helix-turn-helix transcriptional regulator [Pseudomonadales bacterium]|nr:helix-turn-helix transcriptional regulator [Pseudomonadales bacterium]
MELESSIRAFGALAQETRLRALRLLIEAGEAGLPAGSVAAALGVPHNTLSNHLGILANAGLVKSRRESRSVYYRVNMESVAGLIRFLMEDCCQGKPELCSPILDSLVSEDGDAG